jgi:hypothetical protein
LQQLRPVVSPADAARELLARRKARESFLEFNRYIALREAGEDIEPELPAAHHVLICEVLQKVAEGEIRNLMLFLPPGSAKSTYATIRFPAWYLGRFKRRGVISASYNNELAEMFGGKVRALVNSPAYRALFPECALTADTRAKGEWNTENGGFYFAAGVGQGITGRRGDLAIADDLIRGRKDADSQTVRNATWEWWKSDLRTRIKPKTAARVIIMTRWHEDDPAGRILPENYAGETGVVQGRDGGEWYVINIPAQARLLDPLGRKPGDWLWPEYFSPAYWETERIAQGPRNWNSLYQQVPTAEQGSYFKRDWVRHYTDAPKSLTVYMSGDFAVTEGDGDFTELAIWGVDQFDNVYALDWWSDQAASDRWAAEFLRLVARWKPVAFVGEGGPIRRAMEPQLNKGMRDARTYTVLEWLPTGGDKASMARTFQALMANGRIHWPKTDWAERVIDQLMRFPDGRYDDAVDACSLFGRHIDKTWGALPPPPPRPDPAELLAAKPKVSDFLAPVAPPSW